MYVKDETLIPCELPRRDDVEFRGGVRYRPFQVSKGSEAKTPWALSSMRAGLASSPLYS